MKKRVGVVLRPDKIMSGKDVFILLDIIRKIIIEYNCIPVCIVPNILDINSKLSEEESNDLTNELNNLDGIILQGGDDFYDYDKVIVRKVIKENIPVLGICLGAQLLASIDKDNLELIDNKKYNNHKFDSFDITHEITINKDSMLFKIIGKEKINVNSFHKVRIANPDIFNVSAISNDGIIEAIEYNKNDFALGVQWHPEKNLNDINNKKIFDSFFTAVKGHK